MLRATAVLALATAALGGEVRVAFEDISSRDLVLQNENKANVRFTRHKNEGPNAKTVIATVPDAIQEYVSKVVTTAKSRTLATEQLTIKLAKPPSTSLSPAARQAAGTLAALVATASTLAVAPRFPGKTPLLAAVGAACLWTGVEAATTVDASLPEIVFSVPEGHAFKSLKVEQSGGSVRVQDRSIAGLFTVDVSGKRCPTGICANRGVCVDGMCVCDAGFAGEGCVDSTAQRSMCAEGAGLVCAQNTVCNAAAPPTGLKDASGAAVDCTLYADCAVEKCEQPIQIRDIQEEADGLNKVVDALSAAPPQGTCATPRSPKGRCFLSLTDVDNAEAKQPSSAWDGIYSWFTSVKDSLGDAAQLGLSFLVVKSSGTTFPYLNFVQGFPTPSTNLWDRVTAWWSDPAKQPKFRPPVKDEKMGIMTYNEFAKKQFGNAFEFAFFDNYYTGGRVPSWEDTENHNKGVAMLDAMMAVTGTNTMDIVKVEPRVAFDTAALTKLAWNGFSYMGPNDIKYASNGVHGIELVNKLAKKHGSDLAPVQDTLGLLMTDSVFSAHLQYNAVSQVFSLDLSAYEKYTPIKGIARLGGSAQFKFVPNSATGGRLQTTQLTYGGKTYTDFTDAATQAAWEKSLLTGWRFAEKAIIASLLSMTNLVLHVKDLHLELAAAFQAVTVDTFAPEPLHPLRRLLDPYIHRAVQATNDNFKLLFPYRAAEYSLAPLPYKEQLKLINDAINERPLYLSELDMENFGARRNMDSKWSGAAPADGSHWHWRWHHRALEVQRLYSTLATCFLDNNGLGDDDKIKADPKLVAWWSDMEKYLPAFARSIKRKDEWANGGVLNKAALVNVVRTMMVWLSWVHEDVGHSAAAYVYNPIHTPMLVPEDGEGVPLYPFSFNTAAYRGFVFLERAKLLDPAPDFWFNSAKSDKKCYTDFQAALRNLGETDPAFKDCDANGFYSCVQRVETAVSS